MQSFENTFSLITVMNVKATVNYNYTALDNNHVIKTEKTYTVE